MPHDWMSAERLMQLAGIGQFVLTLYWVRNRELRERYAIIWITVASLLLICGFFPQLLMRFADAWHLAYPTAVLFVSLACMYAFSFFVSVSLTRNYRKNQVLLQEVALLENRIRALERQVSVNAPATPASNSGESGQTHD